MYSRIFSIAELLEQILHFLVIDKSLYPTLFVSRLWYKCSAPILWKRIELKTSNTRKIFMEIIHGGQKPVYCLNVIHPPFEAIASAGDSLASFFESSEKKGI